MKLRDHPLMSYRGSKNWPPVWTRARDTTLKTLRGEIGVLTYVHSNPQLSSKCYLIMEYEGETYVGTLIFGDKTFYNQICEVLRVHVRRPIQEIGDLDLSHIL